MVVKKEKASKEIVDVPVKVDRPKIKQSDLPSLVAIQAELGRRSCQYFIEKFVKIEDRDAAE